MRFIQDCEIVTHECVAPGHWRMRLHSSEIARAANPGQFCMVQVAETLYPFLRRPMCFSEIHDDGITILYKVEGEGTALLAQRVPGQTCSIQGPLGNGFPVANHFERHIIVSGGIGVATFPALAKALVSACKHPPEVVLAARNKDLLLCQDLFTSLGCTVYLATDDGSAGEKAYAAEMLERLTPGPESRVYACGPMIMMETTAEVARRAGAGCLVSLEAQMACGDGACLGCVVESKEEREGEKMVRVCVDGPVFDATLIDWEAHNTAYDL
jgi:dihydroorotate dehydrogenase electron transfer subunit